MHFLLRILVIVYFLVSGARVGSAQVFEVEKGQVRFFSDASQELIRASCDRLNGLIDMDSRNFYFQVDINHFMGFNSALQKEHFHENYMETSIFPTASFKGKIIEDLDLLRPGTHKVRAKGGLTIHGVTQERIIHSIIRSESGFLYIEAAFLVPLAEHGIKIPRVVHDKLASDIQVSVEAVMVPRP